MQKPSTLLRSIFLVCLLLSCGKSEYSYIYREIIADVYDKQGTRAVDSSPIKYPEHSIGISMPISTVASRMQWGNTAYALSKEVFASPADRVADIRVITLNDYNANYKAGSNIVDECSFLQEGMQYTEGYSYRGPYDFSKVWDKSSMIYHINQNPMAGRNSSVVQAIALHIKPLPDYNKPQRFAIALITENNVALIDTTVSFIFKP